MEKLLTHHSDQFPNKIKVEENKIKNFLLKLTTINFKSMYDSIVKVVTNQDKAWPIYSLGTLNSSIIHLLQAL